jgi:hypothetical protein
VNLEKERNERKRRVIAHAWHVANALGNASANVRTFVDKCKVHEIDEWELVEQTHQEVMQLFVECGLTEMFEKFMAFALTQQAMQYSESGSEALDTEGTNSGRG